MAYVANDAFCAITDVEALVGRGAFTASSSPTTQQVLDFMARRAGIIESKLISRGVGFTVTSRGNPFPASPSGSTASLKLICERANALGAAVDAILAHQTTEVEEAPAKAAAYQQQFEAALEELLTVGTEAESSRAAVVGVNGALGLAPGTQGFSGQERDPSKLWSDKTAW